MNGTICTSTIRQLEADGSLSHRVPIIAITANVREEQLSKAMAVGMVSHIYCPTLLFLQLVIPVMGLPRTFFPSVSHIAQSKP